MKTILIAITMCLMAMCSWAHACSGNAAVKVERVDVRTFDVCADGLRYRFDAAGPSPSDPRYTGDTQIRLRELWWETAPGSPAMLLQCGQCDLLAAISLDGTTPQWAGGGHGYESGPTWTLALDGVVIAGQADGGELGALAVGGTMGGYVATLQQTTVGYATPGPEPVYHQAMAHVITPSEYRFDAEITAVAYHAVHLDYAIMAQGVTACGNGIWTGAELDGQPIVGPVPCNPPSNVTTNHGPGTTVTLVDATGSTRLEFKASTPRAFRCVQRSDAPHLKCYGRSPGYDSYNTPIAVGPGHTRDYHHTMRFRRL